MQEEHGFCVVEAPRRLADRLFSAQTAADCLDWIRLRSRPGLPRLAIWAKAAPPDDAPDVAICLPVAKVAAWTDAASRVVDRWEAQWLLIESAPRRHREEAREALVAIVAGGLLAAAAAGLDGEEDLPF